MAASGALAQTAAPTTDAPTQTEASNLGDIIVTANKRSEAVNDVPMSITAATAETLQNRGVNSPEDLQKIVPGFSYVATPGGTAVFSLRGVGLNDSTLGARPTVSVYVDESPLPFTVMTGLAPNSMSITSRFSRGLKALCSAPTPQAERSTIYRPSPATYSPPATPAMRASTPSI